MTMMSRPLSLAFRLIDHPELAIGLFSVAMLGGAVAFQMFGGLVPCELCIYQRVAHGAALGLALAALGTPRRRRALTALAAVALLVGAALAVYHVGVENRWWANVLSCAAKVDPTMTLEQLRAAILTAPVIRCEDVQWALLGVSMAGWNAILSSLMGVTALLGLRRTPD